MDYIEYEKEKFNQFENFRTYLNTLRYHLENAKNPKYKNSIIRLEELSNKLNSITDFEFSFLDDDDSILEIKNQKFNEINETMKSI